MNLEKLTDYIPAILILMSVILIAVIVLVKYGDKLFDKEYKASNILVFVTSFLFIIILVVHLFKEQPWTADCIKILIGALIGTGSSAIAIGGSVNGDVAGRDINKNIQHIQDAISKIEGSIVHQNNQINQIAGQDENVGYLINTIYERGNNIAAPIEKVIGHWKTRGWTLKDFSSDYHGMDGIFLIFTKPSRHNVPVVHYYQGSDTSRFNEPD